MRLIGQGLGGGSGASVGPSPCALAGNGDEDRTVASALVMAREERSSSSKEDAVDRAEAALKDLDVASDERGEIGEAERAAPEGAPSNDHVAVVDRRGSPPESLAARLRGGPRQSPKGQHHGRRRSGGGGGRHASSGRRRGDAPPWDMESLKEAILSAREGTGEVSRLIATSRFTPRAPAFTALINVCGKERMANKAVEVFEATRFVQGMRKNTYMYSALVSALGTGSQVDRAASYFDRMKRDAAGGNDACRPNTITYSAMISACERAGQIERAWSYYGEMKEAGVERDLITYSVLLAACEKQGNWCRAEEIIEAMHRDGMVSRRECVGARPCVHACVRACVWAGTASTSAVV